VDRRQSKAKKKKRRLRKQTSTSYTVKGARGKVPVSFDSQTDKCASQLSSEASPEAYLLLTKMKSVFVILEVRCDKYASDEA
jgi:hypothetical protein